MAYWITKSGTLATPNTFTSTEWYRVEAQNPFVRNNTALVLSTTARTIAFTPANAGNLLGGVLQFTSNNTDIVIDQNDVTIKLQELVGGTTWTDRASVTLTRSQIMSGDNPAGRWYTPFTFTAPYAVTAVAGIWRLSVTSPAVTSRYWSLGTSDGTNAMFAVYSDFTGTPTSNSDFIYIAHYTNIEASWTFKAVTATGYTTSGYSGVICRNLDATIANVSYLRIPNPASAITLNIDGQIQVSTHGGVQFGTSTTPIGADKLNIWLTTNSVGTGLGCGFTGGGGQGTSGLNESRWSLIHYGVAPTTKYALATNTCAIGGSTIDVDTPSVFALNDYITIGRRSSGRGNEDTGNVKYKITNISGNTLTFTPVLASGASIVGARVYKWMNATTRATGYGINVRRTETAGFAAYQYCNPLGTLNNWIMKGVFFQNAYTNGSNNLGMPDTTANSSKYLFEDCVFNNNFYEDSNTSRYFTQIQGYAHPFYGIEFKNCVMSKLSNLTSTPIISLQVTNNGTLQWYAGSYTITNLQVCAVPVNGVFNVNANSTIPYYWDGIYFDAIGNGTTGVQISGSNSTINNIDVWGCDVANAGTVTYAPLGIQNLYNSLITNCRVNYSTNAVMFAGVSTNNLIKNLTLGDAIANTNDFRFAYAGLATATFRTINGNPTFDTNINTMVSGTEIGFQDVNATNVDYTKQPYGDIIRCGTGLADTKEHNGNTTLKFISKSGTNRTYWEQLVPTGNIQNKDMTVGVWVWIDNTAYDAGTHEMPRLTVSYDNDTATVYGEAGQVFGDWQFIHASFTPTTTYGQIKVKLTTMTDASLANAPVYFGDMSVLYPAGHTISLGNMNLWADGLPVNPSISTTISAQDVWAADPTTFGTGTIGYYIYKTLKSIKDLVS